MPRPAAPLLRAAPAPIAPAPRVFMLVLLASSLVATAVRAEPMGALALSGGITVRGTTSVDAAALATPLAADDDLLLLSRPQGNRKLFLSALARKATLALERAGFATPKVVASIEPTGEGSGERIVVDVVEGPRAVAEGVEVRGFPDELAAALKRWLQGDRPPSEAISMPVEGEGGWAGERFVDDQGRRVRMEPPLWKRGDPAPFDAPRLNEIRAAIARLLRDQGHFASAALVEDRRPAGLLGGLAGLAAAARKGAATKGAAIDVSVKPGSAGGSAVLVVAGTDLPPRSVLRDVALPDGVRTPKDTLLDALGIVVGGPVTERDRLAWKRKLWESGRFVSSDVVLEEVPAGPDGVPGIVARIALEEYLPATPFGLAPSPEEETMLRFRRWLAEALSGGGDVVATWERTTPTADTPPGGRATGEIVLARDRGLLVSALPGSADACGLLVGRDGLACFFPAGGGRYEVPLPADGRMTANVSLSLSAMKRPDDAATPAYERQLALGFGFESRPGGRSTAFDVGLRVDPVACLAIVHERAPEIRWEGDDLVVSGAGWTARFERGSGRMRSCEANGSRLVLEVRDGRLDGDVETLRAASGDDRADPEALVSSGVAFLTDDVAAGAFDRAFRAAGIEEAPRALRERYGLLLGALGRAAGSGSLAPLDRALSDRLAAAGADPAGEMVIPGEKKNPGDPLMLVGRFAASHAWRIVERDCGRESWPAGLVRLATLGLAQDPAALEELASFMASEIPGPIACLTAAAGMPMPLVSVTLARRGQDRLSAEAFRADCRPLLAGLAAHGLDRTAVALLRSLTDEEVAAIGRLAGHDEAFLVPLVSGLRTPATEEAAVAALPDALDAWWESSLRAAVAALLADRVAPRTAGKPSDPAPVR